MEVSARADGSGDEATLLLTIHALPGGADRLGNLRLHICRGSGAFRYLSPVGWDDREHWLTPASSEAHGRALRLRLDPLIGRFVTPGTEIAVTLEANGLPPLEPVECRVMSASGDDDAVRSPHRVRRSSGGFPARWVVPALAALVIAGGVGSYLWMRDKTPNCATERVDALLAADTPPEKLISAGLSCRAAANLPNDPLSLAAAARLFRRAADSGYCQGALRLGELYDPAELRAGRIGQQPGDYRIAFDNYVRALRLGCDEAQPRLRDLRTVVEAKWREGDPEAELVLQRWPSGRPQ